VRRTGLVCGLDQPTGAGDVDPPCVVGIRGEVDDRLDPGDGLPNTGAGGQIPDQHSGSVRRDPGAAGQDAGLVPRPR
jgi:hypothetical protein